MPEKQQPREEGGADFVQRIVADPKNVPDVMLLYGYSGASDEKGYERQYLSPDLQHYVEVPDSAILHRRAVPKDQDPYGATVLWVRRNAALKYKMGPSAQALANYFTGAIAGAAAAGPAAMLPQLYHPPPMTTDCYARVIPTAFCHAVQGHPVPQHNPTIHPCSLAACRIRFPAKDEQLVVNGKNDLCLSRQEGSDSLDRQL